MFLIQNGGAFIFENPAVINFIWSRGSDSNRRPAHYRCAALPTELSRLNHGPYYTTASSGGQDTGRP